MRVRKLILGAAVAAATVLSACSSPSEQPVGLAAGQENVPATTTTESPATPPTTSSPAPTSTSTSSPSSSTKTTPKPPTSKTTTPKPKPEPSKEAPCSTAAKACIKLSTNQSWLMEDGKVVYGPVPITHGRKGYLTPPGTFRVTFKNKNHKSSIFDGAPMPNSVFFNGGIAFHQGSLREKSHGCIHLSPAASQKYFSSLSVGEVVEVVR
ncbi:Lipoprotein-anchoring transpeptidase ErfK/SrfK [Kibdelosporangium aridum]|uniref:Lipoprotein-anchoring transpeptidase ErfK/SrfK n=2 Tax=Kibdelosporangium aridum TaxID=2030 RepID=A0A1Y5XT89_KIBAR|nr:Lipoprotein-anchoring transpeptidase ErfK/SrfK [Kibdelosporangium aridum]